MNIEQVPIEKIQLDKTQPRKFFDPKKITEMSKTVLTQGIINPIELDEDYRIITGELRYRSAKEAGLKTVPCKVMRIDSGERFERQVVENIHHNTMTLWDTAKALKKLLSTCKPLTGQDKGISELSRKLGKTHTWIIDTLKVLDTSEEMQDNLKKDKIQSSYVTEIMNAPDEIKSELEKKVLSGEITKRETLRNIKRAIRDNPGKKDKILEIDFKGKDIYEAKSEIQRIAPTACDIANENNSYFDSLEQAVNKLTTLLEENPFGENAVKGGVTEFTENLVKNRLVGLVPLIKKFVTGYSEVAINSPIIEHDV